MNFRQACWRINVDFNLGLAGERPDKKAVSAVLEARRREERERRAREVQYQEKAAEYRYWKQVKETFEPDFADMLAGNIHPLYAEAVKQLPVLEQWLDENLGR